MQLDCHTIICLFAQVVECHNGEWPWGQAVRDKAAPAQAALTRLPRMADLKAIPNASDPAHVRESRPGWRWNRARRI